MGERLEGELVDPLVECLAELSRRYATIGGRASLEHLPRDRKGRLPPHQAETGLEMLGLNFEPRRARRLPRSGADYPALVELGEGQFALVLDANGTDLLVWRPFRAEEAWEPAKALDNEFDGRFLTVYADPDQLRAMEAPWHAKGRDHWFWSELRKERYAFSPVLLASLLINVLAIALPLFSMNVYDRVIPNKAQATLWILALGTAIAFGLEFALRRARTAVVDEISHRLDMRLAQKIYGRLLSTPPEERRGHTGALAARVSEFQTVRDFFAATTLTLVVDVAFLLVFVLIIAIIGGWLALVPLTIIAAMAIAGYVLQHKVVSAAQNAQADHGLQQTLLVESLAGMETLKSLAGEGRMMGRWHSLAEMSAHSQHRLRNISSLAVGLAQSFQQVSTIALIVGGYYLFASGKITMGAIIAIVMLSSRSLAPAGQIAFLLTRGRQAKETLGSIERLFAGEDERKLGSSLAPATIKEPTIELENVRFAYPEASTSALDGLNLKITPGERIAVVGRVASGKSTLGRILCGIYRPSDGSMLVNGIDSRQYRPQQLRQAFRFVGQDAALFTGTIKDNLQLGSRDIAEERLIEAMRATGADAFLSRDAGGFDRPVGESGRRLSGGQRAFLSLTRALVTPCELLFLDEPTGAMDSQTEQFFVERLSQVLTNRQTLVIATHRPALFKLCNRLIVLDSGHVVADGPLDEVIASTGATGR